MREEIDFVLPWVDGNDYEWQKEKKFYEKTLDRNVDNSECRYRDWENLHFLFRGIEKFTPWVNKVHFVTWGHVPAWLNVNHPKLNIVNHRDFIPRQYLPTFSVNPIELNIHRIPGLADKFVFFNDDTFIIKPMKKEIFFVNDQPCDSAVLNVHCYDVEKMYILTPFIDIGVINKYFNLQETLRKDWKKWFTLKYGINIMRNIIFSFCPRFPGMLQQHLPNAFLKSTFEEVWNKEEELLNETCTHKFRNVLDANQWLMKEWQLASGNFVARSINVGQSYILSDEQSILQVENYIMKRKGHMICINDSSLTLNKYIEYKKRVIEAFQKVLPVKSEFEI